MWYPQNDTVLVKAAEPATVTESGIHLAVAQVGLTLEGVVTHTNSKTKYLQDKKVLFSKFAGSEVKVGSEVLLIMKADDILAVWQDGE